MNAGNNLVELQLIQAFEAQDPASTIFDVIFEVDGRLIYAFKNHLCNMSTTFNAMLSERWTTNDAVIKVESYTYQEFYDLLLFIFSGEYVLSETNVYKMLDMAEFYDIGQLKDVCDEYISKMPRYKNNLLDIYDVIIKYSLPKSKACFDDLIGKKLSFIFESGRIFSSPKYVIRAILTLKRYSNRHEENIFQAVYEWAENRCIKEFGKRKNFSMNDKINIELDGLLPLINFSKMSPLFFNNIIATKNFLFSSDGINTMLAEHQKIRVTVHNGNNELKGSFLDNWDICSLMNAINTNKGHTHAKFYTNGQPFLLKKNDSVKFYLIISDDQRLIVRKTENLVDGDRLICELKGDKYFVFNDNCYFRYARNCFM